MSKFWSNYERGLSDQTMARPSDRPPGIDELESRCERLTLVCEAMWLVMCEKLGVSEEELSDRVNQIDLSDGQLDGRVRRPAVSCPKCKRTIARRFVRCIYCGQPVMQDPFA